ncbi:MAG: ABC transporter permease [Chloroflexota bacterium]
MRTYVVRRLLATVPVLLLVSVFIFSLVRVLPGDVVIQLIGEIGSVSQEQLAKMRAQLGLDLPATQQYVAWIGNVLQGDGGPSFQSGRPVGQQLAEAVPISLELVLLSILLGVLFAVPLGVVSAIRPNTGVDYVSRLLSVAGLSMPNFWIGTLLLLGLSLWARWIPPLGYVSIFENPVENLKQFLPPAGVLAFHLAAVIARMTRSGLLEVMREDYVRTAWAKGLRERVVVARHALRNALIPVLTVVGTLIARLVGGTVIVEEIFALPGLGRLTLNAITFRDYPQIQFNVLVIAGAVLFINLAIDLAYGWIDPRIRYE